MQHKFTTPKPPRMPIVEATIPLELKQQPNWVLWRWEHRDGKLTKPPYQVNGTHARANDPSTWTDFETVMQAFRSGMWDGIGFMLDGDFTGIDWDDCVNPVGGIDPEILVEIRAINSYTEYSPSGTGLKTLVRGTLPAGGHHSERVGVFDRSRYFCITGHVLYEISPAIESRQAELDELVRRHWPEDFRPEPPAAASSLPIGLSDVELIEKALSADDGGKFNRLWQGDTSGYQSASEADMAMCMKLAFWTGRDHERIDALFRRSGLMREKWNRDSYREPTISMAIQQTGAVYDPQHYLHSQPTGTSGASWYSPGGPLPLALQLSVPELQEILRRGDDGDAELYTRLFKDRYRFDHAVQRWYRFNGHTWEIDRTNQTLADVEMIIQPYLQEAARQSTLRQAAIAAGQTSESHKPGRLEKELLDRIRKLHHVDVKQRILKLAAAGSESLGVDGEAWDADPWLLGCPNGVIDLKTESLRDGRPEDYIRKRTLAEWIGLLEPCPAWQKFITEVFGLDRDLTDYIQTLLGYALIGQRELHIMPVLWGKGRNGKSTLLETIKHVLGDYAFKAESELLLEQKAAKSPSGHNSAVLSLQGKRLVWTSEVGQGRRFDAARVKELTGGDTLSGRYPYGRDHIEFRPTHLLLLLTNHKPAVNPSDFALWQRIHLIPFTCSFVDTPAGANEFKVDLALPEKLRNEAPGILAWLVRGCLKYQSAGLVVPEKIKAAVQEYRNEEDILGKFVVEMCTLEESARVRGGELYTAYSRWCISNGYRPMRQNEFHAELGEQFRSEKGRYRIYHGIQLFSQNAGSSPDIPPSHSLIDKHSYMDIGTALTFRAAELAELIQ